MPAYDSKHWDWKYGSCLKHRAPELPCPECLLVPQDPDLEVRLSRADLEWLDVDPDVTPDDLLPPGMQWTS